LQNAHAALRPGGVCAFHEFNTSVPLGTFPPVPTYDRYGSLLLEYLQRHANGTIGAQLPHLFMKVGFAAPQANAESWTLNGPDSSVYRWFEETARSLQSRLEAVGMLSAGELQVDTLAQRMREEALATQSSIPHPTMVAAFARKP
jgi:hypothetical protein